MSRRRGSRSRDQEAEEDEEIQHGIRTSRDRTTYEYRESSALNPGKMMEQETYFFAAENWLKVSMSLANVALEIVVLLAHYTNLARSQPSLTWIVHKMSSIKIILKRISFWIMWVVSHIELCLLRAKDLTVFAQQQHRFQPNCWRRIAKIKRDNCYR